MHQLADDVDSRVRRASVCSVVSITGALQLNLSHAAGQHADEAGTASNRRGSVCFEASGMTALHLAAQYPKTASSEAGWLTSDS